MTYIPAPPPRLGGKLGHIEARRVDVNRVNDMLVKPNRVTGFYEISFQGPETTQEVLLDVDFPVWFVEEPGVSFSARLKRPILEVGFYPSISVVVVDYVRANEVRPGGGYWTGMQLAVVASGRVGEEMTVHWQADGHALKLTGTEGGIGA